MTSGSFEKYILYSIAVLTIVWGIFSISMLYENLRLDTEARSRRQLACNLLNPKYGKIFVVHNGFYEGQLLETVKLEENEYIRGYILQDSRTSGYEKSVDIVVLDCLILKPLIEKTEEEVK